MRMIMTTGTIITITNMRMAETALYKLLTWMSPSWPIGAFAHSGGLEWAVEAGHVTERAGCTRWLADLLTHGPLHNDAVIFTYAWRAAKSVDAARLRDVAELAHASQTSHERRVEATAQGAAFRRIVGSTDGTEGALAMLQTVDDDELCYPVITAVQCAVHDIALEAALMAFLHAAVANLVSAAQRLVPLGQTDGQLVLRDLELAVHMLTRQAAALPDGDPFDAMAGCTLMADLGCMAHETQYTRLFRT